MGRRVTGWKRYLVIAPSAAIGVIGLAWILIRDLGLVDMLAPDRPALAVAVASAAVLAGILASAWVLEKALPSFRYAGDLMERVLRQLELSPVAVVAFATLTALAEELFFRGALLAEVGLWPQAILFGLLHPATRKGWSYPVFTFAAGLALGWLTLFTGTLWAAIAVHFAINLYGMWEASRGRRRVRTRPSPPVESASVQEGPDPVDRPG